MFLQEDWNKYSEENFEFVILHEFDSLEDSINKEQYYINSNIGIGYNIGDALNGGDRMKNNPRKEETRKLKSKIFSGKGNPMYGKKKSKKMIDSVKKANSKKVSIEGKIFNSGSEAAEYYKLKKNTVQYRLKSKSEKFKNWFYI